MAPSGLNRNTISFIPVSKVAPRPSGRKKVCGWLPTDPNALQAVVKNILINMDPDSEVLCAPVQAYKDLIETDGLAYMTAVNMIEEAKAMGEAYSFFSDYNEMLKCINHVIQNAPKYTNGTNSAPGPLHAVINWVVATKSGREHYCLHEVNAALKRILETWGKYLSSSSSLVAFQDEDGNPGGWMNDPKLKKGMAEFKTGRSISAGSRLGKGQTNDISENSDELIAWGYSSWNAWFTREFKAGARPFENAENGCVINSACESTPFGFQQNVRLQDRFWAKNQPYSLTHMLNNHPLVSQFDGGTVYQAYLGPRDYHRWHSPVDGTIKSVEIVSAGYYSESPGVENVAEEDSQGYIANMATRAIVFIQADEKLDENHVDIGPGLMCFVSLGMSEVSSNVVTVEVGDKVKKGDQLGYFQFGGSSHCLVFRKNVIRYWNRKAVPELSGEGKLVKLGMAIGSTDPHHVDV